MTQTTTANDADNKTSRALPDNADPAVDYKTVAERPGTLRGDACLVIQTRQAQRLVYGRKLVGQQPGIIGLVRFGMLMKRIWVSAMLDDPYADWYLLQIDETLETGRVEIRQSRNQIDELLGSARGVEITVAHSLKPARVPLQFANPYGYMGAYLVGDYDELVCAVLTARHVGLLSRDHAEQMLQRGGRLIRRTFLLPTQWKHCAVDRTDLEQNNQRAQAARAAMGELPQDVLEGTHRARHAPEIRQPRIDGTAVTGFISNRPIPADTESAGDE
ncbi:MAG: TIGR03761 family integrating conjugative element protein [Burkholderiaceae bacterium]